MGDRLSYALMADLHSIVCDGCILHTSYGRRYQ